MYKALKSARIKDELATAAVKALESHITRNLDGEMDKILAKFDVMEARLDARFEALMAKDDARHEALINHFTILKIITVLYCIIASASSFIG